MNLNSRDADLQPQTVTETDYESSYFDNGKLPKHIDNAMLPSVKKLKGMHYTEESNRLVQKLHFFS